MSSNSQSYYRSGSRAGTKSSSCCDHFPFRFAITAFTTLGSFVIQANALYAFSIRQPQHSCGKKTATHEGISVVHHQVQCINIKKRFLEVADFSFKGLVCVNLPLLHRWVLQA